MNNTKNCPQCDSPFTGRSDKIYCSLRCKSSAFNAGDVQSPTTYQSVSSDRLPVRPTKRAATTAVSKRDVDLLKLEFEHKERLKQIEYAEAQRDRNHEVHQLRYQLQQERRTMAELMIALQRQCQQATGQVLGELPDASKINSLDDVRKLANQIPQNIAPLPTLPIGIKQEAKEVFDMLTDDETDEWTKDQLTEAIDNVCDVLKQVRTWQQANQRVQLNDLPVHGLLQKAESVLRLCISKLKYKSQIWGEPSIELCVERDLVRAMKRYTVQ